MNTKDIINSLFNNDSIKFEQAFTNVMAQKVSNVLSDRRNEMSKTIFNHAQEPKLQ